MLRSKKLGTIFAAAAGAAEESDAEQAANTAPAPALEFARADGSDASVLVLELTRALVPAGERDGLTASTPLTGLLDSFAIVELIGRIEERTGIALDLDAVTPADFYTAEAIVAAVRRAG
jgi:acyl carrier protein